MYPILIPEINNKETLTDQEQKTYDDNKDMVDRVFNLVKKQKDKAEFWNTTVEHAKSSRCSNCGAFDQKKSTIDKITKAIGEEGKTIAKEANFGFCEFFWFKCAGARVCDAWVGGGPIK